MVTAGYSCNANCHYCCQKHKKTDRSILDLPLNIPKEIVPKLVSIDLLGGELSSMPQDYLNKLCDHLDTYNLPIHLATNLLVINDRLTKYDMSVSLQLDNIKRQLNNISLLDAQVNVSIVATDELMSSGLFILDKIKLAKNIMQLTINSQEIFEEGTNIQKPYTEDYIKRYDEYTSMIRKAARFPVTKTVIGDGMPSIHVRPTPNGNEIDYFNKTKSGLA